MVDLDYQPELFTLNENANWRQSTQNTSQGYASMNGLVPVCVEVSARARIPVKYRVCWGPLQTHKDTRQILKPLYNCPFGIQALKLETRIQPEFATV